MLTRFYSPITRQSRRISMKQQEVKQNVKMDEETQRMIEAEELKPRKHAGRMDSKVAEFPGWLRESLAKVLEDSPLSTIIADGTNLSNFLKSRHSPPEISAIQTKYAEIKAELAAKRKLEYIAQKSEEPLDEDEHAKSLQILKQRLYAWAPVQYNKYTSLLYLVSRSAQDYAVLHRIFGEIAARDKEFQPTTLFDFGSGIGTVIWATSGLWPNSIQEHMCVDVSTDMSDLSELIVSQAYPRVKGIFHRQYIPLSDRTYDMTVNAYSLLELPNMKTRLEAIAKLWAKTGKYLVIVEQGTNAGFKVVTEARDFILHLKEAQKATNPQAAHVFSPCPHDLRCPRKCARNDNTPCNFEVTYNRLPLKHTPKLDVERYCYVVLKKGERADEAKNWPRIVRPTLVRSKHTICRLCTTNGTLDEIIFTASKHGKWMYRCARSSRWGDRLPLNIVDKPEKVEDAEKEESEHQQEQ